MSLPPQGPLCLNPETMGIVGQQANTLRQHYLFSGLSDRLFEAIATASSVRRYDDGELVFQQGGTAQAFFVVSRGAVELYAIAEDGHKKTIEVLQRGQSFAEALTFMTPARYPVTAQALGPIELFHIPCDKYRDQLANDVSACLRLVARLCQHLHSRVVDLEYQAIHSARERLVLFLLSRLPHEDTASPVLLMELPRQVIASRIGVQPETLSRLLRQMIDENLVEVSGRTIKVLDLPRLRSEIGDIH